MSSADIYDPSDKMQRSDNVLSDVRICMLVWILSSQAFLANPSPGGECRDDNIKHGPFFASNSALFLAGRKCQNGGGDDDDEGCKGDKAGKAKALDQTKKGGNNLAGGVIKVVL